MSRLTLSRRGFLKATGTLAGVVAAGELLSFDDWKTEAYAAEEAEEIITRCTCCSNQCAIKGLVKDGRIVGIEGVPEDPTSTGTPCVRGYSWPGNAYATEGRVLHPARRKEDGSFENISWDTALTEIADKLKAIVAENGPESVAYASGVAASQGFYATRFFTALGTPNTYNVTGACKISLDTAWQNVVTQWPSLDWTKADYVVLIGRAPANGIGLGVLKNIAKRHGKGEVHIISVDPRLNNLSPFIDEWLPIKPGTDLAFILALSQVVVAEGLYNKAFVEEYTTGFDEYKEEIGQYTPEWAEKITDIPAETITRIAHELAAANHGAIEQAFRGGVGVAYDNSVQTVRALALFDALLGAYGVEGGLKFSSASTPLLGSLDPDKFPTPTPSEAPMAGHDEYPIAPASELCTVIPPYIEQGRFKAAFFYATNPVRGSWGTPAKVAEQLRKADLLVTIEIRWSETASISDYVLPDTTYVEADRGVFNVGTTVFKANKLIEPVNSDTLPAEEIFRQLADKCGLGTYFSFTQEDREAAALSTTGISAAELDEKGVVVLDAPATPKVDRQQIPTESGKIDFASQAFEDVGLGLTPGWKEPLVTPGDGEFRVIAANEPTQGHTYTTINPVLFQIAKSEHLDRVWINSTRAKLPWHRT